MASLGLAFGAWGLPWESGDAPGIGCEDAFAPRSPPPPLIGANVARRVGWRLLVVRSKNGLLNESELGF